jgi:hypothetical protein
MSLFLNPAPSRTVLVKERLKDFFFKMVLWIYTYTPALLKVTKKKWQSRGWTTCWGVEEVTCDMSYAGKSAAGRNINVAPGRYEWQTRGWSTCSEECGGGRQKLVIHCVDSHSGKRQELLETVVTRLPPHPNLYYLNLNRCKHRCLKGQTQIRTACKLYQWDI